MNNLLKFTDIQFQRQWHYQSSNANDYYKSGVIPGKLFYSKLGGNYSRTTTDEAIPYLEALYDSGMIDNCQFIRVVDYSEFETAPIESRKLYARTLKRLNEEHNCYPKVTYICGASLFIKTSLVMFSTFTKQRFIYIDTIEEAFAKINSAQKEEKNKKKKSLKITHEDIEEINAIIGNLLYGDTYNNDLPEVSKSNPLTEIAESLKVAKEVNEETSRKAQKEIYYQFNFRQLLMEFSSMFINLPLYKTESAINNYLAKLCNYVGADRSYIFEYNFEKGITNNTHEFCQKGIEAQIDNLQQIPLDAVPQWVATHTKGEIMEIPDVLALPNNTLREILEQQDIKSLLAVPLMAGSKCIGFIGFDSVRKHHTYSEDEKQMIKIFAQMLVNVYQRKESEENKAKLSMAIEQNPTSIVITNKEGTIEYVNPITIEMTGYSQSELVGSTPGIFKSGKHDNPFYNQLWETINSGKTWEGEILNRKKNGELFWEKSVISPIITDNNLITHFVAVKEDITDRKSMITQLEEAKDHAEESDRLKSAFLANMSHEIRSPLNGIIGFASFLEEYDQDSEKVQHYAEIISNSGKHLLNIINNIIYISKLDAGHIIPEPEIVNVSLLLNELYKIYKEQIESGKENIKISFNCPKEKLWVITDETRLRQILENLLSNSIKFTHQGSIDFGCKIENDRLIFFVKDTGIGIPKDKHAAIFERFIQASEKTEKVYGGTGLGLAISKACAKLLGGDIWVSSEVGEGTTFYFDIEYKTYDHTEKAPSPTGSSTAKFSGEHILVAEDDDVSYFFLKEALNPLNLKISRTVTGIETVKTVLNEDINLVLMDIQMPEMNGWEATREIRKHKTDLPIIAQTAFAFENDKEKSMEAGCNDYIAKPVEKEKLLEVISNYL